MIAEARLISEGLGGADADFTGGGTAWRSGEEDVYGLPRPTSTDCRLLTAAGAGIGCEEANASSASLSVTFWFKSFGADGEVGLSNSNFVPFS